MNKITEKILYLYVITTFFTPIVFSFSLGVFELDPFRILIPALFLLCLLHVITCTDNLRNLSAPKTFNTYTLCFFIVWLLYAFITVLWSINKMEWAYGCAELGAGVLTIVVFSFVIKDIKQIEKILAIIVAFTMLHAIIGINEIITGKYLYLDEKLVTAYTIAKLPVSCFVNTNDYAMVMLIGFFSAIGYSASTHNKTSNILVIFSMFVFMAMCILTGSRANIIGLLLGIIAFFFLYRDIRRKMVRLFLCSSILLVLASQKFVALRKLYSLIPSIHDIVNSIFHIVNFDSGRSDNIRLNLILNGFNLLKKYILLGTGIGNIESNMALYAIFNTDGLSNIHNWWMEILVSSGVFIFVGYIIFYGKLVLKMHKISRYSYDKHIRRIAIGFFGFLISFILASISSSSNLGRYIIWMYFATIIAFEKLCSQKIATKDDQNIQSKECL